MCILFHDLGTVGAYKHITAYSSDEEQARDLQIRTHPQRSAIYIEALHDMESVAEYIKCHHERHDGQGYPDRLPGENLHAITKILTVVDAFDAMVSIVAYRVLSPRCALQRLEKDAGTQFDPETVSALTDMFRTSGLLEAFELAV